MKQVSIIMPQMGQSVAEGVILSWRKKVGEDVLADEVILEIETDKTSVEVESPSPGKLASCMKQVGEVAMAGEVIGMIETLEDVDDSLPTMPSRGMGSHRPYVGGGEESVSVSSKNIGSITEDTFPKINRDYFSPAVLRLAMSNNITLAELESIKGTGKAGRVTRNDLLSYLLRRPVGATTVQGLAGKEEVSTTELENLGKVVPMTSIRRTIADHMVQSIRTSAHVTMVHAVDMTHIVNLRAKVKDQFQKNHNAKMTYTAILLFVTSRVLRQYPVINASVSGTVIIQRSEINIGCAVALSDESLVVPIIRCADQKSFPEIAAELGRLITTARNKELTRQEIEGGTFTISNFGAFGSIIGTPIINQPQVAILGMGAVFKAPVVIDDEIKIRYQMYLSFSFDHRVIDGALGGKFLNAIQQQTESITAEMLNVEAV